MNDTVEAFEPTNCKLANRIFASEGTFRDVSSEAGPDFQRARAHRAAAFADSNSGGRMDVVASEIGEADRIEIRWPCGIEQVLTHVRPNQVLSVREPER